MNDFFVILFSDLVKLYSASILIAVLTLLSLCAWKLIIDVFLVLYKYNSSESQFFIEYENFCQNIAKKCLTRKSEIKLLNTMSRKNMRPIMQNINTILLLSFLSPLIGLLGTVQGMISTFTVLSTVEAISSAQLTSGISEALLTTQCGLMVAIPTLLVGGILYRKAQKIQDKLRIIALHSTES